MGEDDSFSTAPDRSPTQNLAATHRWIFRRMHLCRLDDGKCAGGGRTRQPSICCGDAGKGRDGRPIFDDSHRQTLCLSPQRLALNTLLFGENVIWFAWF